MFDVLRRCMGQVAQSQIPEVLLGLKHRQVWVVDGKEARQVMEVV